MNTKHGLILIAGATATFIVIASWPSSKGELQSTSAGAFPTTPAMTRASDSQPALTGSKASMEGSIETRDFGTRPDSQQAPLIRKIAAVTGESRAVFSPDRASEPAKKEGTKRFSTAAGAVTIELSPGVRLPLALMKTEEALYPGQIDAREKIKKDFEREIADALRSPNADKVDIDEVWNDARRRADSRFRLLFGDDAYNRASIVAAKDSLSSTGQ